MFPATMVLKPAVLKICPIKLVVVVLPFVPVTAMIGALQNHDATSISLHTFIPSSIAF